MPKLDRSTSSQDQYPVGANASQTQPYVPIERTIGIGQLPPIHLPSEQSLFVIQEGGLTGQITLREVAAYFGNTPVTSVNGQTGDVELKLSDLVGVTIIDPLNNNFLSYNAGKWINKSLASSAVVSFNGFQGVITNAGLNILADVTVTDPVNLQTLMYSSSKGKWENRALLDFFPDITDKDGLVTITGSNGLRVNNALNVYGLATYHGSRPVMTTLTPTTNASSMAIMNDIQTLTLNDLANVDIIDIADKDFILWDATTNKWQNYDKNEFFPDFTDTNGLITITGPAGLRVNNMLNTYGAVTFHDNRPIMTNVLPTTNQFAVSTMGDLQNLDLNHLHDVSMSNPVPNGNVVSWNEKANKWINVDYDPTGHIPSMLWTPTSVTTGEFSSVCFDANLLSLILASKSNAGLYWTKDNKSVYQSNITSGNFYKVIVFKDVIYAAGDVGVLKSTDGKIWTTTSIIEPATNLLTDGNILLIFFHANIGFKQTSDGTTFTSPVTSGVYEVGDVEPKEDPTQNIWLLGGSTTTQNSLGGFGVVSYSLDGGSTWVAQSTAEEITAITYARGNSFLASSTDGLFAATVTFGSSGPVVTWEKLVEGNYTDVVFNSGLILALRLDDIPLWSTDAFNWNPTTGALPSLPLHTAAFGNGYWSAGGLNTGIWWSIDGKEWALSNQVTGTLNKVIYGGTAWLALMGDNGGILWSNNTAGKVLSVNGQTGIVEIGLNNLRGTKIIAPTDGDFLIYKNGLWENKNIVDVSNISVHNLTVTETATIHDLQVNTSVFGGVSTFNGGLISTTGRFNDTLTGVGANFTGSLNVANAVSTGTLIVNDTTTLKSTLSVTGTSTLADLRAATGTFSGALVAHDINSTTILNVAGASTLAGVTATTLGLTDTLTGIDASFSGALSVTGSTTLESLTSNGNVRLKASLQVDGNTMLGTLYASNPIFQGTVNTQNASLGYDSRNTSGNGFKLFNSWYDSPNEGVLIYDEAGVGNTALYFRGGVISYNNSELATLNSIAAARYAGTIPDTPGTDLLDYTTPGQYVQLSDTGAALGLNYPTSFAGLLTVSTSINGSMIWQTYTLDKDPGTQTFTRNFFNGIWGRWYQTAYTDSPYFEGIPTAPTAPVNTNTTQLATTAFVQAAIGGGGYPNLTSSGTGVDTLLTYTGTQGVSITKGPLVLSSEIPSIFAYRPSISTLSVGNTAVNSVATISDITSGTLLAADFKSINSRGGVGGVTLNITSGASISGTTTLGTLSCVSGGFSSLTSVSGSFSTTLTAPTPPVGTNTNQVATTAFVAAATSTARFAFFVTSTTFTVPVGIYTVYITGIGGGGGGGGGGGNAGNLYMNGAGGGGGGAGYVKIKTPIAVSPGTVLSITIGAGGAGGAGSSGLGNNGKEGTGTSVSGGTPVWSVGAGAAGGGGSFGGGPGGVGGRSTLGCSGTGGGGSGRGPNSTSGDIGSGAAGGGGGGGLYGGGGGGGAGGGAGLEAFAGGYSMGYGGGGGGGGGGAAASATWGMGGGGGGGGCVLIEW